MNNRVGLFALVIGSAFGFLIQASGFGDADFIHRMLLLQNWYPYEVFGSAIVTALPLFWLLERIGWVTPLGGRLHLARTSVRPRHVYGGVLFGTGWAFSATCPVPALAMLAGGGILGSAVISGLLVGILLGDHRARVKSRATSPVGIPLPSYR